EGTIVWRPTRRARITGQGSNLCWIGAIPVADPDFLVSGAVRFERDLGPIRRELGMRSRPLRCNQYGRLPLLVPAILQRQLPDIVFIAPPGVRKAWRFSKNRGIVSFGAGYSPRWWIASSSGQPPQALESGASGGENQMPSIFSPCRRPIDLPVIKGQAPGNTALDRHQEQIIDEPRAASSHKSHRLAVRREGGLRVKVFHGRRCQTARAVVGKRQQSNG